MKRAVRLASGIGIFLMSVVSLMAILKLLFDYQAHPTKLPLLSIITVTVMGTAVVLSFMGCYIFIVRDE
jgi:ABC-type long-subunit fatty acid transport system fused permease/ATPase subunit